MVDRLGPKPILSKDWPCLKEDRLESYDLALASDVAWRGEDTKQNIYTDADLNILSFY